MNLYIILSCALDPDTRIEICLGELNACTEQIIVAPENLDEVCLKRLADAITKVRHAAVSFTTMVDTIFTSKFSHVIKSYDDSSFILSVILL